MEKEFSCSLAAFCPREDMRRWWSELGRKAAVPPLGTVVSSSAGPPSAVRGSVAVAPHSGLSL